MCKKVEVVNLILERPRSALLRKSTLDTVGYTVYDRIFVKKVDFTFGRMNVHIHCARVNLEAMQKGYFMT